MLTQYLTRTRRLLQNPGAPAALYSDADLTDYINQARGQLAGDAECIRNLMTKLLVIGTPQYAFSGFTVSAGSVGISGALNVRQITVPITGEVAMLNTWPWEYFNQYYVAKPTQANAVPTDWAQFGQGVGGVVYFSPTPSVASTLTLDCVCYPIPLVDDTTAEAIPFPWTDAVPYFAAYLALLAAQAGARDAQALRMLQLYEEFKTRARKYSTPAVMPFQYEQSGTKAPVIPADVGAKRAVK